MCAYSCHLTWQTLQGVTKCDSGRAYTITQYSDLDHLMGEGWHYRVYNTRGDFAYAMLETIRFHLFHPKPILEYSVALDPSKKLQYTPMYTMQGPQLVFSFVRHDGNHRRLIQFLS